LTWSVYEYSAAANKFQTKGDNEEGNDNPLMKLQKIERKFFLRRMPPYV
jgi:hypothetical protein